MDSDDFSLLLVKTVMLPGRSGEVAGHVVISLYNPHEIVVEQCQVPAHNIPDCTVSNRGRDNN